MTVFLAWTSEHLDDTSGLEGPWSQVRLVAPGLLLLESTESLSRVYHALKWSLADEEAALIVTPVDRTPKLRGLAAGTTSWLRERTQRSLEGDG